MRVCVVKRAYESTNSNIWRETRQPTVPNDTASQRATKHRDNSSAVLAVPRDASIVREALPFYCSRGDDPNARIVILCAPPARNARVHSARHRETRWRTIGRTDNLDDHEHETEHAGEDELPPCDRVHRSVVPAVTMIRLYCLRRKTCTRHQL